MGHKVEIQRNFQRFIHRIFYLVLFCMCAFAFKLNLIKQCENVGFLPHMLAGILLGDGHFGTSRSAILAKETTALQSRILQEHRLFSHSFSRALIFAI